MTALTFQEMLDTDDIVMGSSTHTPIRPLSENPPESASAGALMLLRAEEGPTCWAECTCRPGLAILNSSQCTRCWNRGHTNLVRTVSLQDNVVITGSYDATVKVCLLTSSRLSRPMLMFVRSGTERLGDW